MQVCVFFVITSRTALLPFDIKKKKKVKGNDGKEKGERGKGEKGKEEKGRMRENECVMCKSHNSNTIMPALHNVVVVAADIQRKREKERERIPFQSQSQ